MLEQALQKLRKGDYGSLPSLFPELVEYHRYGSERLRRFGQDYPSQQQLLQAARADLVDYQNAVGALAEAAWEDAEALLAQVAGQLDLRRQAMEQVRRREGLSPLAELDELAWDLQRNQPTDTRAVQKRLARAVREVTEVLQSEFPDPRLQAEWRDLWLPLAEELTGRLQQAPELALLPRLEEFFERCAHWLGRARQRRDFSPLAWWQRLRLALASGRLESDGLEEARAWLQRDLSEWPEADRQLRLHYLEEARRWLDQIEDGETSVNQLVAFGDLHYDRWLWLGQSKA